VSCFMVNVINVLIANGASRSIVYNHVLFGRTEVSMIFHIEFSYLQRVLLALHIYGSV
jgi:hypothetical protein